VSAQTGKIYYSRQKTLVLAVLLSVLLHTLVLLLLDLLGWLDSKSAAILDNKPQKMILTFPENKPEKQMQVVENLNNNQEIPKESNLLSEQNSKAKNPLIKKDTGEMPYSRGNIDIPDFSPPSTSGNKKKENVSESFNRDVLLGKSYQSAQSPYSTHQSQSFAQRQMGRSQVFSQEDYSAEDFGGLSLSTYKWEWAPYVNSLKDKLMRVWYTPPAYYKMGLIHGHTIVYFIITREGELEEMKVLQHEGHSSLEMSSTSAIKALFPFMKLPDHFPEEKLAITAKLIYPDLRNRR
jgi:outer membrane biosynthesis protein TonB